MRVIQRHSWLACVLTLGLAAPQASAGLIINATFDAAVPVAMQTEVNNAIGIYQGLYSDSITISILLRYATTSADGTTPLGSGSLAQSQYTIYNLGYSSFITSLTADKKTANDNTAIANLPGSAPNGATQMVVSSANGRAVGQATPGAMNSTGVVGTGGTYDGIVTLNSGQNFQFNRAGGIASNAYDAQQSIEHEMDEIMGLGSAVGGSNASPQDLFRYSAPGTTSFTSSAAATAYFSINGGNTNIAGFNQVAGGDYGDWSGNPCTPSKVQCAFTSPGVISDVTAAGAEGIALDVIGYDLITATPEPGSLALFGAGLAAIAARRRVRR